MFKLPESLTRTVSRHILKTKKNSPTLLFAAGVVGVVATTVLASRATLKLEESLEDIKGHMDQAKDSIGTLADYDAHDYRKDMVLLQFRGATSVLKLYAPAIGVGALSIACLTQSHRILTQRNVVLTAAYAALEQGFREYRDRVREELGDEREMQLRHSVQKGPKTKGVTGTKIGAEAGSSIYARFFDQCSRNWSNNPGHNQLFIQCQQNYCNDLLRARGHLFLNEVYDMLGLERSPAGAVVGWLYDGPGDGLVDFGVFHNDTFMGQQFALGDEKSVLLDFNVDGVIYDKI